MIDRNLIRQVEEYLASPLFKDDLYALDEKSRVAVAVKVWQVEKKDTHVNSEPDANLALAIDIHNRLRGKEN